VIFKGDDNLDQLYKITEVLGAEDVLKYIQRYKLKPDPKVYEFLYEKTLPKRKLGDFVNEDNKHLANEQAQELLKRMLVIDHVI
jgi:casein kinase II subunit alpha